MRTSIRFRLFRILAVAIALTMAAGAAAQGAPAAVHKHPFIELGLDYNYVRANAPPADCGCFSMNGGDAWAAYNFTSSLAAVAQFSAHHASNVNGSGADLTLKSYLFGGRYSWRNSSRFMPFGQALFGGSHAGTNLSSGASRTGEHIQLVRSLCRGWTGCVIDAALRRACIRGRLLPNPVPQRGKRPPEQSSPRCRADSEVG